MMRKWLLILAAAMILAGLLPVNAAAEETEQNPLLKTFVVRNGDRKSKKIAEKFGDIEK